MSVLNWTLLAFCLILLIFVAVLGIFLIRVLQQKSLLSLDLLTLQVKENQRLRNLILAPDLQTLQGLNQVTGVPNESSPSDEDLTGVSLGEALDYEEALAMKGMTLGDVGYDLSAAGWPSVPTRTGGDEPVAYES